MSRLDNVLKLSVEGFLFYDLRTMERDDEAGRGVGFPVLMSACAGIEFLGALLSSSPFQSYNRGQTYFRDYWRNYLYPAPSAHAEFHDLTYSLVRHGIAHSFALKGRIGVLRKRPALHFVRDSKGILVIDAVQLAHDFVSSYESRVRPLLASGASGTHRVTMESRLAEMESIYDSQAVAFDGIIASAPMRSEVSTVTVSPSVALGVTSSPPRP